MVSISTAENDTHAQRPLRPPLKWAGGKRWIVPHLQPLWDAYRRYRLVEPLCGGLAVTLGLMPERALLNDLNPHNINFFRWLGRGLIIEMEMANDADVYYRHRARFNDLVAEGAADSQEAAGLFYYLNRTCYNGLCRFNRSGQFNVPFGRHRTINYTRDFALYQAQFSDWEFRSSDFESITLEPTDFIYADPPYDVEFTQYSKESFKWEEQVRLAEWLARHSGPVVLSNQATKRICDLYSGLGFELTILEAPRMISCNGDRTKASEVIATRGTH